MAGKKGVENTKKVAGNARKAEAAAAKQAEADARKSKVEDEEWVKGAKASSKKDAAEAKKAEAARKKTEREAQLAEEERTMKAAKTGNAKSAAKKNVKDGGTGGSSGTLDMTKLDGLGGEAEAEAGPSATAAGRANRDAALTASGIDNALDALTLTTTDPSRDKVDRHPERRFRAAYIAYETRRLPEVEREFKGLRRNQRIEIVRREFERHPDNPFNQASARFDSSKHELEGIRLDERRKVEERLTKEG